MLRRTGEQLASLRSRASGEHSQLIEIIDSGFEKLVFDVPLSLADVKINVGTSRQNRQPGAMAFVTIASAEARASAHPAAQITQKGAMLIEQPGLVYPGKVVTRQGVRESLATLVAKARAMRRPLLEESETNDDGTLGDDEPGTGAKMSLDDGKMGSISPGQYAMKRPSVDKQLDREEVLTQARNAGILSVLQNNQSSGSFIPQGLVLILADTKLPAVQVALWVRELGDAFLAVSNDGEIRAHEIHLQAGLNPRTYIEFHPETMKVFSKKTGETVLLADRNGVRDWKQLASVLLDTKERGVGIGLFDDTPVSDLIRVLDLVAKRKQEETVSLYGKNVPSFGGGLSQSKNSTEPETGTGGEAPETKS